MSVKTIEVRECDRCHKEIKHPIDEDMTDTMNNVLALFNYNDLDRRCYGAIKTAVAIIENEQKSKSKSKNKPVYRSSDEPQPDSADSIN